MLGTEDAIRPDYWIRDLHIRFPAYFDTSPRHFSDRMISSTGARTHETNRRTRVPVQVNVEHVNECMLLALRPNLTGPEKCGPLVAILGASMEVNDDDLSAEDIEAAASSEAR